MEKMRMTARLMDLKTFEKKAGDVAQVLVLTLGRRVGDRTYALQCQSTIDTGVQPAHEARGFLRGVDGQLGGEEDEIDIAGFGTHHPAAGDPDQTAVAAIAAAVARLAG